MATATRRPADERLAEAQTVEAWDEYLAATRGQSQISYAEVEEWAWARLRQRLRTIAKRRKAAA